MVAFVQDITERKRVEDEIKQANERLLLATSAGGVDQDQDRHTGAADVDQDRHQTSSDCCQDSYQDSRHRHQNGHQDCHQDCHQNRHPGNCT